MTLRLILTRHAKSDWDNALEDHDRPLSRRGRRAAADIGQWLRDQGHQPARVLVSSSARTRETWDRIDAELASGARAVVSRDLYLAAAPAMMALLQAQGDTPVLMMIGHNPGTAILAEMLATNPPRRGDFHRYPTCFTTIFEFDLEDWAALDWGLGRVMACISPRELE